MTESIRKEMLINNNYEWYVVDYENGETKLVHASGLSNILQCGEDKKDFGIINMEQCWNGEDIS